MVHLGTQRLMKTEKKIIKKTELLFYYGLGNLMKFIIFILSLVFGYE